MTIAEFFTHLIASRQQAFVLVLMLVLLIGLVAFRKARRSLRQKTSIDSSGMDLVWLLKNKRRSVAKKFTHKNKSAVV